MDIAARAWNAIKADGDPEYACIENKDFVDKLNFAAERVLETGLVLTHFDAAVLQFLTEPVDEPVAEVIGIAIEEEFPAEPAPVHADNLDAKKLAKQHDRKGLEKLAKKAGLDGNAYMNKQELAAAILAATK